MLILLRYETLLTPCYVMEYHHVTSGGQDGYDNKWIRRELGIKTLVHEEQ